MSRNPLLRVCGCSARACGTTTSGGGCSMSGGAAASDRRGRRGRGDLQPDHLPEGHHGGQHAYDHEIADLVPDGAEHRRDRRDSDAPGHRHGGRSAAARCVEATGTVDGWVSIEVAPALAFDTKATVAEVHRLRALVDRPNVLVKVPATADGVAGDPASHRRGHQHQRHAHLRAGALPRGDGGLSERASRCWRPAGAPGRTCPLSASVHGVASFFVSRVDSKVDQRLDALMPSGRSATAGRASARLSRARRPSPTPSSPTASSSRPSPVRAGRRWPTQGAQRAAAALGQHEHQEPGLSRRDVRRGAHRSRTRSTPCPRPPSTRSATTAWSPRRVTVGVDEARRHLQASEADGISMARGHGAARDRRGCRPSPTRSTPCWRLSTRSGARIAEGRRLTRERRAGR